MTSNHVITREGLNNILNASYLDVVDVPTKINIGIGTVSPLVSNTSLGRKIPISDTEVVDDCTVADWNDSTDADSTINSILFKTGGACISIEKDGITEAFMSVNKATTSRNFTDKDFWMWIYVEDKTDLKSSGTAIEIRFGSDSSNYYYYEIDIDDVVNGWNAISFDSSTSTTGSPVITACDYSEIIFYVDNIGDTIAADRILIDDLKLADSDSYDKVFDLGFPKIDILSSEIEMQTTLTTSEAVGYPLTEIGHLNSSGLLSHSVSSADNKTSKDIFIQIERIKILNSF